MVKSVVGRKQLSTHEDWVATLNNIEKFVSRSDASRLVDKTVSAIRKQLGSGDGFAYAWSGGKDSQVLDFVLRQAGYKLPSLLGVCNLEYPAFIRWMLKNKPDNLTVINTRQDLEWLAARPEFLFPTQSKISSIWFSSVQHKAQDLFLKRNDLRCMIFGRRRAEGNYLGQDGSGYYQKKSTGLWRYLPIMDWTHEETLAVMKYNKLAWAPYYKWPRGFRVGSGPWAKRRLPAGEGELFGWRELKQIDPSILATAAPYFPKAGKVLNEK